MTQCIILTGGVNNGAGYPVIQRSLGPYRLASALEDAGYSVFVFDYIIHFSTEEIFRVLSQHLDRDTLWVGFSSTFFSRQTVAEDLAISQLEQMYYTDLESIASVMDYVKTHSRAKLIYGGARAPLLADLRIDYYVLGYADTSTVALTNYIRTGDAGHLVKIDSIKVPGTDGYVNLIDSSHYPEPKMNQISTRWWNKDYNIIPGEGLPFELARGCIFKCKFCNYPLLGKKKGTYLRDPEEIRDELTRIWEAHGTTNFYITDDTFNDDNDKIEALHRVFTSLPFKPKFVSYLRLDLINKFPHQADLLTEMGLVGTYFGIESLQAASGRSIGKGLAPNKVKDRLYWLADRWKGQANMAAGFILGLPYDTEAYFKELIAWCNEADNPLQMKDFYPLYLFYRKPEDRDQLGPYTSEFSLNPEIYGYNFPRTGNHNYWELPTQGLTFDSCAWTAMNYKGQMRHKNKFAEFQMISAMNAGVELDDLLNLTQVQIFRKYNIDNLNQNKIQQYKKLLNISQE
jgi:radical SAM superfamily enzyme YgiQ (UPF0313 family)